MYKCAFQNIIFHNQCFNLFIQQTSISMSEAIKVVVRVRPMNQKEKDRGCSAIVNVDDDNNQISILKPDQPDNTKFFAFDNVFGEKSKQETVYTKTAYQLVENVITGYNGTIFAYGQTGCGKTHSMVGKVEDEEMQGIIPRSFGHILKTISETKEKQFLIRCSFIEIYNEEVRDLLSKDVKNKLDIKESTEKGVFIKDLSINTAKTHEELMDYMNLGNKNRSVGQTAMNKDSSRSHLLFALYLESADITESDDKKYVASKLNLVDLAGSERISKTGVSGDRLKEAQKINLSLSALGNVISALVDGKSHHIPYRDSKLTRLLQDSLGGNTKTIMIANCSPADYNFDETLSTLRYASRAKFIKNKPIINEDPKDALLKQYALEIKNLKEMLQKQNGNEPIDFNKVTNNNDNQKITEKLKQKEQQLSNQKEEKRKLLERIHELQNRHVEAKDVHINQDLMEKFEKVKVEAEQSRKRQLQMKKKVKKTIEDEEKQIQSQTNETEKVEKYRCFMNKMKQKVKRLEQEIKDINHENYLEKENNLEDIRVLSKENKLLQGILNVLLQQTQFQTVREQCEYNEDRGEYRVPPFYFKSKQLVFPKLQENQSMDMIRQMQDNRSLIVEGQKEQIPVKVGLNSNHSKVYGKENDYAVKDVIKQARNEKKTIIPLVKDEKKARKVQLEPIKKE